MTKNQIEYFKAKEQQRNNLAIESLTAARDATSRELGFATLGETTRHNLEGETQQRLVLGESIRHNIAMEEARNVELKLREDQNAISRSQLSELSRHNLATESAELQRLQISKDTASEQARHNMQTETADRMRLILNASQFERQQSELERSHRATESEVARSNQVREAEQSRHNRATEHLSSGQLGLGYAQIELGAKQLEETVRTHQAQETETKRSNIAREQELTRSHLASELEQRRSNIARERENRRSALERESATRQQIHIQSLDQSERARHNQMSEILQGIQTGSDLVTQAARYIVPLFS